MAESWEYRQASNTRASRARRLALDVCAEVRERNAFAHNVLEARLAYEKGLPAEERAFAVTLALGVTQTIGTLDEVINNVLSSPRDIHSDVRDALRVSTYEILFLNKDAYAAVDQGVELVRSFNPSATRVANFALRRIAKAKRDFPFGDPETDQNAFARSVGFPYWLAELLVDELGRNDARSLMAASNEPAPIFVSINPAKASDREVLEVLLAAKAEPEPVAFGERRVPGCFQLHNRSALIDGRISRQFKLGNILVSDAASQEVARIAVETAYASRSRNAEDPVRFLEIGAGRATKTILLQALSQRMHGKFMEMTCVDNQEFKVNLLRKRVEDYSVPVKEAIVGDATCLDDCLGDAAFDAVFLDAPCTGLGTLRRHPEIRWRVTPSAIDESAQLQLDLLMSAAACVLPGGVLVYATCTVTREENVGVVKRFLESELGSHFRIAPIDGKGAFASTLLSGGPDAHFCVRMVRLA